MHVARLDPHPALPGESADEPLGAEEQGLQGAAGAEAGEHADAVLQRVFKGDDVARATMYWSVVDREDRVGIEEQVAVSGRLEQDEAL